MSQQSLSCRQHTKWVVAFLLAITSCKPRETQVTLDSAQVLGAVLAEEAIHAAGLKKQVVLVTADAVWGPPSPVEAAFTAALKKQGVAIVATNRVNIGDPMRSGAIGLKADDFFKVLDQFPDVGAVISIAGAPLLSPGDSARLKPEHPPVLVVATAMLGMAPGVPGDRVQLARLLIAKTVRLAIIDRSDPGIPPSLNPDRTHQVFAEHYQILRQAD